MPWKNGGGITYELAVWPEGADLGAFDARLSMALVASDGPFSVFPGVDRTLAVIEGAMRLGFSETGVALSDETAPLAFPGEAPVAATVDRGPVLDLNVMTRRDMLGHRIVELRPGEALPAGTVAVVARDAATVCDVALAPGDAILADGDELDGNVSGGYPLAVTLHPVCSRIGQGTDAP